MNGKSSKTETQLRKILCPALEKCGAKIIPYVGSSYGQKGTSDIFLAHKYWHGWIEFKGPKTPVNELQEIFIHEQRIRLVNAVIMRLLTPNTFLLDETAGPFRWETGFQVIEELCKHDCLSRERFQY